MNLRKAGRTVSRGSRRTLRTDAKHSKFSAILSNICTVRAAQISRPVQCGLLPLYSFISSRPKCRISLTVSEGTTERLPFFPHSVLALTASGRALASTILPSGRALASTVLPSIYCLHFINLPNFCLLNLIFYFISLCCGFGGLGVACWPLVPKFAGSNPAEAVGFLGRKNPQHAFLRRGSKAVGPMS